MNVAGWLDHELPRNSEAPAICRYPDSIHFLHQSIRARVSDDSHAAALVHQFAFGQNIESLLAKPRFAPRIQMGNGHTKLPDALFLLLLLRSHGTHPAGRL